MKFIFRWLRNKLRNVAENQYLPEPVLSKGNIIGGSSVSRFDIASGMNFSIHRANGGYVVQYSQYDKRTDRSDTKLHIVTDDKDLGEELGKIISFESLRA